MKSVLSNCFLVALYMGLVLILSGCPKKVSPVGKDMTSKPESSRLPSDGKGTAREGQAETGSGGLAPSLSEEDISESTPPEAVPVVSPAPDQDQHEPVHLADIFFDFGQWTVRATDTPLLQKNAEWLSANPERKVSVEGHADKRGTSEYNLVLAEKRAVAAHEYLVQLGIPASRMIVMSYGEERPFCTTEDETCYQENRRAHFNVE